MSKSNLDPTQEVLNNMFGRSIYGHFKEIYKNAFRVLCENGELFTELQKFTEQFRSKYLLYISKGKDHQFSFNEAYDEIILLIKTEFQEDTDSNIELISKDDDSSNFFDLDFNPYIDSASLN